MGTITHVATQDPVAALTFDDGPDPTFTPQLLDILQCHGAYATFFMVGKFAESHPDLVRRVAMAGHAIGNHSWDHASFPLLTRHERLAQIDSCACALAPYGQRLFRPPFGDQDIASHLDLIFRGYQVVTWNVIGVDWLDNDAKWIRDRVVRAIKPGSVILLHDRLYHVVDESYGDRSHTLDAVDLILESLSSHFQFVTLPELFRHGSKQRENWYKKPNLEWSKYLKT